MKSMKMSACRRPCRLCVLIDADNARPADIGKVLTIASGIGNVCVKKIYGGGPVLEAWKPSALAHDLTVMHQFAFTPRKNATDMALTIDAMDMLHEGGHSVFCLVSSDSDFTPLARRLKNSEIIVHGFGNSTAPRSLQVSCSEWHEIKTSSKQAR